MQPHGAPALTRSWQQQRVVTTNSASTIADGVAGRYPIAEVLADLLVVADDAVLVREEPTVTGMRLLMEHAGLVVEPSAALGIVAILEAPERFAGRRDHRDPGPPGLVPARRVALCDRRWESRLAQAMEVLGARQGEAGVPTREPVVEAFFDRPYHGVGVLAEHVLTAVTDTEVRALPGMGTVEQWSENVMVVANSDRRTDAVDQWLGLRTAE